jgi:amino-acid N-acetyltransferase
MNLLIRKAGIGDSQKIKDLIKPRSQEGIMLSRPIYEIYENIRDYFVALIDKKLIGSCALHVFGKEYKPNKFGGPEELILAEIRALVVDSAWQRKGIGTKLIKNCIKDGRALGITKIFALTLKNNVRFFKKFGFKKFGKGELPQKIWSECIKCPRFPSECNEIALYLNLKK